MSNLKYWDVVLNENERNANINDSKLQECRKADILGMHPNRFVVEIITLVYHETVKWSNKRQTIWLPTLVHIILYQGY